LKQSRRNCFAKQPFLTLDIPIITRLIFGGGYYLIKGGKIMKRIAQHIFVALVICALAAVTALADKTKTRAITLPADTMVNGVLLKAGDYEMKYDEATGQLSIAKTGGKVLATVMTHTQARDTKAPATELKTVANGSVAELVGVTFQGWTRDVMLNNGGATVGR
jgi:hypothetical protein